MELVSESEIVPHTSNPIPPKRPLRGHGPEVPPDSTVSSWDQ